MTGWALVAAAAWAQVPAESTQLVTGLADHVDASWATVQRWERAPSGWSSVGLPVRARLGKEGLAWGVGLHPQVDGERPKVEGDGRAPMGIFDLGTGFTEWPDLDVRWPMVRTTMRDLWVEDPFHPAYNTHVRVPDGPALTPWEQSQRMRLGDEAHALKVVVEHNTRPPTPGQGSAIFFHIWRRGGDAPTAGCTAMPAEDLRDVVAWLRPDARPVYALLSRDAWERHGAAWHLPSPPVAHTSATSPPEELP